MKDHGQRQKPKLGQAFTLLEMIVCVIIVGLLAAIATASYAHFVDGARDAKARHQLRSLSTLALAYGAENDISENLTQPMYVHALASFPDVATTGTTAGGLGWSIIPSTQVPTSQYQFSVAFDNGIGTPISDDAGTRVAVVTRSDTGRYFAQVELAAPAGEDHTPVSFRVPPGATSADVLAGAISEESELPYGSTPPADGATPADPVVAPSDPNADPVTNPVSVTPHPETDWLSCSGFTTGSPASTVTAAQIGSHGDTDVWWQVDGDTDHVTGYKICGQDSKTSGYYLLASTGPGTADARTWVVRTNQAHPNIFVSVVTVLDDGAEYVSTNNCEVKPAGGANGWPKQPRGC